MPFLPAISNFGGKTFEQDFRIWTSEFRLQTDFGFQPSDFRIQTDFGIKTSNFGRISDSRPILDFRLRTDLAQTKTSNFGLPTSRTLDFSLRPLDVRLRRDVGFWTTDSLFEQTSDIKIQISDLDFGFGHQTLDVEHQTLDRLRTYFGF